METSKRGTYSLFLLIILFGMLHGGSLYEHLVYFPVYLSALPESTVLITGKYGLHIGTFWLTIHPLLILSNLVALALNWRNRPRRRLILITSSVYFSIIVVTQLYFLPELGAFRHSPESNVSPAEWLARGRLWLALSWVRLVVMLVATLPLLHALTTPARAPQESETVAAG